MSLFASLDVEIYEEPELELKASPTPQDFYSSPSQISVYELCPRKWAHRYVDGVVSPPNKFAAFGIRVHSHLEYWLKEKLVPEGASREATLARAMIPHLPPPQAVDPANVEIEGGVQLGGIRFVVKQDLYVPMWEGLPTVFDHKTSRTFDYALAPELMGDDVQASLYALWLMTKTRAPRVRLVWNYGRSEGAAKVHPVRAELTGADVRERLSRSIQSATETRDILSSGCSAMDVPYNAAACGAFGGCPYQDLCNLTPQEKMESIMSQADAKAAFAARVAAKKNGAPAPQAVNPPPLAQAAPVQAPAAAPAASSASGALAAKLAARKAQQPAAAPAAVSEPAPEVQETPVPSAASGATRGPGRPPKQPSAHDQWTEFASAALAATIGRLDGEDIGDDVMMQGAVEIAAGAADKMTAQWAQRFAK